MDAQTLEWMQARVDKANELNSAIRWLKGEMDRANAKRLKISFNDGRYWTTMFDGGSDLKNKLSESLSVRLREAVHAFVTEKTSELQRELAEI